MHESLSFYLLRFKQVLHYCYTLDVVANANIEIKTKSSVITIIVILSLHHIHHV